jgi:hypothetical protein
MHLHGRSVARATVIDNLIYTAGESALKGCVARVRGVVKRFRDVPGDRDQPESACAGAGVNPLTTVAAASPSRPNRFIPFLIAAPVPRGTTSRHHHRRDCQD